MPERLETSDRLESPKEGLEELKAFLGELARRNVKLYELVFADLHFLKPRVRKWLRVLKFPLEEVLTEREKEMVRFYSGLSRGERMHSLEETAAFIGKSPKAERFVAAHLRYAWLKLKRRELVGPEAVETLKLPDFLYKSVIGEKVEKISDILSLSDKQLIKVCGAESVLSILRQAMKDKGIDFNPKVTFPLFPYNNQ